VSDLRSSSPALVSTEESIPRSHDSRREPAMVVQRNSYTKKRGEGDLTHRFNQEREREREREERERERERMHENRSYDRGGLGRGEPSHPLPSPFTFTDFHAFSGWVIYVLVCNLQSYGSVGL
jgi:hypothetical protein